MAALMSLAIAVVTRPTPSAAASLTVCASGCQYTSIGAATGAAASGDVVIVGPGHYLERVTITGKNVTISGPVVGATNVAVLDAGGAGRALTVSGRYNSQGQLDTNVSVSRLTITGGHTTDFGGGAAALEATLALRDCLVAHNSSTGIGGGLYTNGGIITLFHVTLTDNVNITSVAGQGFGGGGGVAAVAGAQIIAISSVISNNTTTGDGGGLLATEALLKLTDVSVIGNRAGGTGGGLAAYAGTVQPKNVLIVDNRAIRDGGGAELADPAFAGGNSVFIANYPNNCNAPYSCP